MNFTLPPPGDGMNWYRVTDTCGLEPKGPEAVAVPAARTRIRKRRILSRRAGQGYSCVWRVNGGRGLLLLIAK